MEVYIEPVIIIFFKYINAKTYQLIMWREEKLKKVVNSTPRKWKQKKTNFTDLLVNIRRFNAAVRRVTE